MHAKVGFLPDCEVSVTIIPDLDLIDQMDVLRTSKIHKMFVAVGTPHYICCQGSGWRGQSQHRDLRT